ncbi:MAG: hypothetical protein HZB26_05420 [Candidatus Hydrogenedentes bacterium]|nr:hypothetical protein [Candidatus Hydrogenedentota bacterium]
MDNKATAMRQEMDETRAGLADKLGELEHQISGTVRTVKDSVNAVLDTFDLKLHVRRRPWTLMAGATALGYLGGFLSSGYGAARTRRIGKSAGTTPVRTAAAVRPHSEDVDATSDAQVAQLSAVATPSWLANLGETFQPEIAELRGIVIGALLELARDIITKKAPQPMERSAGNGKPGSNGDARNLHLRTEPLHQDSTTSAHSIAEEQTTGTKGE